MKTAICIPSYGYPKLKFLHCLSDLLIWSLRQHVTANGTTELPEFITITSEGAPVAQSRDTIAELALNHGSTHLFWLDDDQTFPDKSWARLLSHDLPVVGANYPRRLPGKISSAANFGPDRKPIPIQPADHGLETVDVIGLGCALMKAEIFEGLPKPWFSGGTNGEDAHFFETLARERNIRPVVDHGLRVDHIHQAVLSF